MSEQDYLRPQYFPWQTSQRIHLQQQLDQQRLPHALLLSGISDIGKKEFALSFAAQLLCRKPEGDNSSNRQACGDCASCYLVNAGSHPDLRVVRPEESRLIRIEQIRDLIHWAAQTSQQGGAKIAVLYPGERMNVQSANALLKCLEEPGANTYFFLITDQAGRLLPTIRSRCQALSFPVPDADQVLPWLQADASDGNMSLLLNLANGAPLRVINHFDAAFFARRQKIAESIDGLLGKQPEPVALASSLLDKDKPLEVYDVLYGLFSDALKFHFSKSEIMIINNDLNSLINVIYTERSPRKLLELIELINTSRSLIGGSTNPNLQMLLESVLMRISG
ncbi:MAG: DNA polymerase III subunit delta' [Pseudomonadales bacterium]